MKHPARILVILIVVIALLGAAIGTGIKVMHDRDVKRSVESANSMAEIAALTMTDDSNVTPTTDLARKAVGQQKGVTIDALEAEGTSADGTVTLRIALSGQDAQCYGYRFQKGTPVSYNRLNYCTDDPALKL